MNILIDIGNTSCKVAFCPGAPSQRLAGADVRRFATQKESISYVRQRLSRDKADTIILSNVRKRSAYLENMLMRKCRRFINFDEEFVHGLLESKAPKASDPLTVLGNMPQGMGADRMAAIFGAEVLYPLCDKLVFDFGTATTVEFIDAVADEGSGTVTPRYVGGSISLGLQTRYRALSHYTARIPYLNPEEFLSGKSLGDISCVGYDLDTALAAGNILGIMFEIKGYVAADRHRKVILTGGHAELFADAVDGGATVEKDLVLTGLEAIIELL